MATAGQSRQLHMLKRGSVIVGWRCWLNGAEARCRRSIKAALCCGAPSGNRYSFLPLSQEFRGFPRGRLPLHRAPVLSPRMLCCWTGAGWARRTQGVWPKGSVFLLVSFTLCPSSMLLSTAPPDSRSFGAANLSLSPGGSPFILSHQVTKKMVFYNTLVFMFVFFWIMSKICIQMVEIISL